MHISIGETLSMMSAGAAAWLMLRASTAKGAVKLRKPQRCGSCGKLRTRGSCRCTSSR
jgi:hypothetical protein